MKEKATGRRYLMTLCLGALGVVFGDIGTSPLYALKECFYGAHGIAVNSHNVLGVLSLIFWSLILIVSIKYLGTILRADNKGEGGILALMALAFPEGGPLHKSRVQNVMIALGIFGTALLYGDGVITPAISVLSAVEGLNVATDFFEPYIIPITVGILVALFSVQRFGTAKIGKVFGIVTLIWFFVIGVLGIKGIVAFPKVLFALNPAYGARFLFENGAKGFVVLGAVFLVVTGAEALYADMGHFGKRPIRIAWFGLVLPALMLNYFGQGALLLTEPGAAANPFFQLAPHWALYPLVVLATCAAVIASQALISGAFSLTMQAVQLGYFPRMKIEHTSSWEKGQIYIGHINWALMLACIALVMGFRSSSNLAAAYGIAVSLTMVITTVLFYFAARRLWNWSAAKTLVICVPFLVVEMAFLGANALKIFHGGWFPLAVGVVVFTLLTTWKSGRRILAERLQGSALPLDELLENITAHPPARVRGTAIFLSGRAGTAPLALLHNLKHNKILHERVVFLTVISHDIPYIEEEKRIEVELMREGFYRVTGHFGFMEERDLPKLLERSAEFGLKLQPEQSTYFLSKETLIASPVKGMAIWREVLFVIMSRNAVSAASFFKLPPNRVVELGMQIEL